MDIKIALQTDGTNPNLADLYLDNGTVGLTNSLSEEVAQELFIRLNFFQGEWFLDTTQGIPYFQSILGQKTPLGIVEQIFRQAITTCPGVASLASFSLTRVPTRGIQVFFTCILADGTTLTSSDFGDFVVGA